MNNLLEKLVWAFGPSGEEEMVRAAIAAELKDTGLSVSTDSLGNLVASKPGRGPKLMVAAHMDEIGFIVTHIDEEGFIRFAPVGTHDPAKLWGARVTFGEKLYGIIGVEKIEELKELKMDKLYIDIGAESREEAEGLVQIGTMATFSPHYSKQGNRILAKSLDNRAGCTVLLALAQNLPSIDYQLDLVFTVQEEVGLRGARTGAFQAKPDAALALDVTRTGDTPEAAVMEVTLGKGPAIKVKDSSFISHPGIRKILVETARQQNIPYQMEILEKGGTDAGAIHISRSGVPTGVISIPARHLHSPGELIDYRDLEGALQLLKYSLLNPDLFKRESA